ncbi:class I SAM-dependent methyltransferase [Candidatus Parcubacteria bacterium]|nr:class I SAM-dependent methyltransferase [Candidatus Parcubacteria bacterium]
MRKEDLKIALTKAYKDLEPYSDKYKNDFDRYLFSLSLLTSLSDIERKRVVDIGTGIGLIPLALKNLNIEAEGIDHNIFPDFNDERFAINNFSKLKLLWEKNNLAIYDVDVTNPSDISQVKKADVIISEATIEHLKDPKKFLELCRGLLLNGGFLLLSTPNIATLIKRLRFLGGKTTNWPIESFYEEGENFTGHWREYTMSELLYMAKRSRFEVRESHTRNALSKFKPGFHPKKNFRAFLRLLSSPFPGMREIHYVLMQKQ